MISLTPPSVSPSRLAASMAATMAMLASGSVQRTGESSTADQKRARAARSSVTARVSSAAGSPGPTTGPMATVWLCIVMSSNSSKARATAPTATRAADDLGVVALHLLALAASVPQLASPQVRVDSLRGERQPRGHAFDDDGQLR